jgi:putative ABC transport system permease protein
MLTDLKLSLRQLARSPGFTVTVLLVLALGIGATTAIFSVINAVLLHPFPYTDAGRITFIGSTRAGQNGTMPVTYPDFLDWRRQAKGFAQLAYASNHAYILTKVSEPASVSGAAISASAWTLLGIRPALGRVFTEAEDRPGADRVCVLSAAAWLGRFGGDPQILQRTVMLDGKAYTVVGVMPAQFKFWGADIWTPIGLDADTDILRSRVMRMNSWVVGKLGPGTTLDDARAELKVVTARLARQYPDTNKDIGADLMLLSESVTGPLQRTLLVLLAAVACVLLIACANVANLLLARAAAREKEFAIRAALGASRGKIIAQVLLESLPLAVGGGIAGLIVAVWGLQGLLHFLPADAVPAEANITVDTPVMLFTAALTLGSTLLFALVPAWESSRDHVNESLKDGARGTVGGRTGRLRAGLIVVEVSLSLTLLIGAGLLIRSFARLQSVNPGFSANNLLLVPVQLPEARYPTGHAATQFFTDLLARAEHLPGITSAALASNVPFNGGSDFPLLTEGRTYADLNELQSVQFSVVQGDYFRAQGLRLVRGRAFAAADNETGLPVIVLNEAAVKKFLPTGNPLGRRVMLGAPDNLIKPGMLPPGLDHFQWATVVGVVQDARHFGLQSEPPSAAYIPVRQSWDLPLMRNGMTLLLRTAGDPLLAAGNARQLVAGLDRDQPVGHIASMEMVIGDTLRQSRFNTLLLGIFAALAFVLAVVGIYGVVAWNVTQRTREIGVRSALGATRGDVLRLVVGQGMRLVLLGVLIGLGASFAVTRLLQSLLFETSAFDALTFIVVSGALAIVALVACLIPARRATRVDPMVALRAE